MDREIYIPHQGIKMPDGKMHISDILQNLQDEKYIANDDAESENTAQLFYAVLFGIITVYPNLLIDASTQRGAVASGLALIFCTSAGIISNFKSNRKIQLFEEIGAQTDRAVKNIEKQDQDYFSDNEYPIYKNLYDNAETALKERGYKFLGKTKIIYTILASLLLAGAFHIKYQWEKEHLQNEQPATIPLKNPSL